MLRQALGAGEPDLKELLDALEELHVVGGVVLGVRHPLSAVVCPKCDVARDASSSLPFSLLLAPSVCRAYEVAPNLAPTRLGKCANNAEPYTRGTIPGDARS